MKTNRAKRDILVVSGLTVLGLAPLLLISTWRSVREKPPINQTSMYGYSAYPLAVSPDGLYLATFAPFSPPKSRAAVPAAGPTPPGMVVSQEIHLAIYRTSDR